MNYHKPPLRRAMLAAGAVIATAGPAVLFAAPANAAPTITFTAGVLTINGDAGNNGLVAGQTPAHIVTLNGTPVRGRDRAGHQRAGRAHERRCRR